MIASKKRDLKMALVVFAGCLVGGTPALAGETESREAEARKAVKALMSELSGELKAAMKEGGPSAGIGVCVERAPEITGRLSREKGWRVTRVSDQVRNPLLGMPDAWEQETLQRFRGRHADGASYKGMSRGEVVAEPGGKSFRYMQAIPQKGVCMSCHGDKEALSPAVREKLAERYPHDRATGYEVGDLRGAFSIKQPLE
ncbi:Tll0287-like domain-containing protein [Thiohalorhabdus sp.]|uniref:Tll0287-like domain-containing protein n=1 Tax=Thiohalorhabdus sp. TaxID=3094134 RepID=UPI002FC2B8A9